MVAIMGRMASHFEKLIRWEDAFNSEIIVAPDGIRGDSTPPIKPNVKGIYAFPIPGVSDVI